MSESRPVSTIEEWLAENQDNITPLDAWLESNPSAVATEGELPSKPIQQQHPELPTSKRLKLKIAADYGPRVMVEELGKLGFTAHPIKGGQYAIKKGSGPYYVIDPNEFGLMETLKDIFVDYVPTGLPKDIAWAGGAGLGAAKGLALGTATAPVTGPVGPVAGAYAGGVAGAAAGSAAGQGLHSIIAKLAGIDPTLGEVAGRMGTEALWGGGIQAALPVAGKLIKGAGEKVLMPGLRGGTNLGAKALGIEKRWLPPATRRLLKRQALSGQPMSEELIDRLRRLKALTPEEMAAAERISGRAGARPGEAAIRDKAVGRGSKGSWRMEQQPEFTGEAVRGGYRPGPGPAKPTPGQLPAKSLDDLYKRRSELAQKAVGKKGLTKAEGDELKQIEDAIKAHEIWPKPTGKETLNPAQREAKAQPFVARNLTPQEAEADKLIQRHVEGHHTFKVEGFDTKGQFRTWKALRAAADANTLEELRAVLRRGDFRRMARNEPGRLRFNAAAWKMPNAKGAKPDEILEWFKKVAEGKIEAKGPIHYGGRRRRVNPEERAQRIFLNADPKSERFGEWQTISLENMRRIFGPKGTWVYREPGLPPGAHPRSSSLGYEPPEVFGRAPAGPRWIESVQALASPKGAAKVAGATAKTARRAGRKSLVDIVGAISHYGGMLTGATNPVVKGFRQHHRLKKLGQNLQALGVPADKGIIGKIRSWIHIPTIPEKVRNRLKTLLKVAGKPAFDVQLEKALKDKEFREWWERIGGYQATPAGSS